MMPRKGDAMSRIRSRTVARGLLFLAVCTRTATAGTITVNSTADSVTGADGRCTLREAIANVNAAADTTAGDCAAGTGTGDVVTFALALPAVIQLTSGQLMVEQSVDIVGPTVGTLRISGARASTVLRIAAGATVRSRP